MSHIPVMVQEVLEFFKEKQVSFFFDGTLGAGGFAKAFLNEHPEITTYFGCDQDTNAHALAKEKLGDLKKKVTFLHGNFRDLDTMLDEQGIDQIDGFFLTWECHRCN